MSARSLLTAGNTVGSLLSIEENNKYYVIDGNSRTITPPENAKPFGVESDKETDGIWFKCPKVVGNNIDLTTLGLRVNFKNANGNKDKYIVRDITVDGDYIYFFWEFSKKVTLYAGNVNFIVCAVKVDSESVITNEWNTTLGSGLVLAGLEVENPEITPETSDLVEQLLNIVDQSIKDAQDASAEAMENIAAAKAEALEKVETAEREAVENISNILDKTLSKSGKAADAKAVGDMVHSKASAIICEASGEVIVVNDSAKGRLSNLKLFGKSSQEKTHGYQLFDATKLSSVESGGAKITNNGDGSFTVSGEGLLTAEISTNYRIDHDEFVNMFKAGTLYVVSNRTRPYFSVNIKKKSTGETLHQLSHANLFCEITQEMLDDDVFAIVQMYANEGDEIISGTTKPVLYQDGAGTWEKYTGGKAAPNPEYPQVINSVENPVLSMCGKNLLSHPYVFGDEKTENGATFKDNGDGGVICSGTPTGYVGTTLTSKFVLNSDVAIKLLGDFSNIVFDVSLYNKNIDVIASFASQNELVLKKSDYPDYTMVTLTIKRALTNVPIDGVVYPIIVAGDKIPLNYEVYKEPKKITIPYTLHGIPVESGGNYTDAKGQQYICDEVDFKRGALVQRVKKVTVDETSNVQKNDNTESNWLYFYVPENKNIDTSILAICDKLQYVKMYGIYGDLGFNNHSGNYRVIYINISEYMSENTIDAFKAALNQYPLTFIYALGEPVEIPLTDDELAAYYMLFTNHPNTTLLNDQGAYMEIEYLADTEIFIKNNYVPLSVFNTLDERVRTLENAQGV